MWMKQFSRQANMAWKPLLILCAGLSACSDHQVAQASLPDQPNKAEVESLSAAAKKADVEKNAEQAVKAQSKPKAALPDSAALEGYAARQEVLDFVDEMVKKYDFSAPALLAEFAQVEKKDSILKAMSRPAEKVKPWHEYRNIFIKPKRIKDGIAFWQKHQKVLAEAEKTYGVPAEIIVSIIGVETFYGRITGSYRVMDALSTLAFDYPKRAAFFRKELEAFLLLSREQNQTPLSLKGSYAGAMGYGQFMPSSYRAYAQDFDKDGFADVWKNPTDAIGSVANYFKRHGWQNGESVVIPAIAQANHNDDLLKDGFKPKRTLPELKKAGFLPSRKVTLPTDITPTTKVRAITLEGVSAPEYWMTFHNFYVITRYNRSSMYAMAVYQLSQAIKAGMSKAVAAQ